MAAAEAGPSTVQHGDVLLTHPQAVDEVFMLLGGPECQPFSKAGHRHGLKDRRARTLWWVLWCLAERQFPTALIENVEELLHMKKGEEWALVQAIAEGIGYKVQAVVDDPLLLGIPHQRRRAFIFFLRDDLAAKWGHAGFVPDSRAAANVASGRLLIPSGVGGSTSRVRRLRSTSPRGRPRRGVLGSHLV
jgi:site-specific DNA-cytosine methylase